MNLFSRQVFQEIGDRKERKDRQKRRELRKLSKLREMHAQMQSASISSNIPRLTREWCARRTISLLGSAHES